MNLGVGVISSRRVSPSRQPTAGNSYPQSGQVPGLTPTTYFKRKVSLRSLHSVKIRWDLWNHKIPSPRRGAKGLGARFEKKALTYPSPLISETSQNRLISGPIFDFIQGARQSRAIPDALLWSSDWNSICVIECKLRHSADAFYQIQAFYLPLVKRAFPSFRICSLELCKFYDPSVRLPRPVAFITSFEEAFTIRECFHPVLIHH